VKRPKRPKCPKLVMVLWLDAVGDRNDDDGAGKPLLPVPCLSVGWCIEDKQTHIKLASELISGGEYQEVTVIPRGMVKAIAAKPFKLPAEFREWASD